MAKSEHNPFRRRAWVTEGVGAWDTICVELDVDGVNWHDLATAMPYSYSQTGYFDESEDQDILAIAGFFAPEHHWRPFNAAWENILKDIGVDEFHTQECENRKGFWETWNDPSKRREAQQRFLDCIFANPSPAPAGLVVGVDLAGFRATLGPNIKAALPRQGLDKPWLYAFVHVLGRMVEAQAMSNQRTERDERVDLYFDQKDEFRGRVEQMLNEIVASERYPLGRVTFADSRSHPGLQAADVLAYEARRCLTEVILRKEPRPVRDQFVQVMETRSLTGRSCVWADFLDAEVMKTMSEL